MSRGSCQEFVYVLILLTSAQCYFPGSNMFYGTLKYSFHAGYFHKLDKSFNTSKLMIVVALTNLPKSALLDSQHILRLLF